MAPIPNPAICDLGNTPDAFWPTFYLTVRCIVLTGLGIAAVILTVGLILLAALLVSVLGMAMRYCVWLWMHKRRGGVRMDGRVDRAERGDAGQMEKGEKGEEGEDGQEGEGDGADEQLLRDDTAEHI